MNPPWLEGLSEDQLRSMLAQLEEHEAWLTERVRRQERDRALRRLWPTCPGSRPSPDFSGCVE